MTKMKKTLFPACMLLCLSAIQLHAQVTIGSGIGPVGGALLDLKEKTPTTPATDNTTATKGMMLPRVSLTDLNKLYPMFATGYDAVEDAKHTGLTVYNVNQCPAGRTIYDEVGPQVWNGSRWESLIKPVIVDATPTETSAANTWGTAVVRHQAKAGVYEEFYSAWFGDAGRWMTTNLAAWTYDGISHSQGRTLEGPNANFGDQYNAAYWCYPNGGDYTDAVTNPNGYGGEDPTSYDNNPHIGLLYTWDVATAGKGGDTGRKNIYNTSGGTSANDEGNFEETTTMENGKQQRIQGICPQGWHLPSDREWNELEKEIYTYPQLYSYYTDKTGWSTADWQTSWENSYWRPSLTVTEAHGKAMKEVCGVNSTDPNGQSKNLAGGGFSVLLASGANSGIAFYFGYYALFWSSSSSHNSNYAWYRYLDSSGAYVGRDGSYRNSLWSVRCKKD